MGIFRRIFSLFRPRAGLALLLFPGLLIMGAGAELARRGGWQISLPRFAPTRAWSSAWPRGGDLPPCPLGRWLGSPARREAEHAFPELTPWLARLEAEHAALHQASRTIHLLLQKGDRQAAALHSRTAALPAYREMLRLLMELQRQGADLCRTRPDYPGCWRTLHLLHTQLGSALCGLILLPPPPSWRATAARRVALSGAPDP